MATYSSFRVYQDQVPDTSKLVVGFSIARYVLHMKLLLKFRHYNLVEFIMATRFLISKAALKKCHVYLNGSVVTAT